MVGDELSVVLVRRGHIDLEIGLFALHGERSDDIVRFESGHFEHRYVHRLQDIFDDRHGFAYVLRRLGPLRFVLLVSLMAECAACRVKSDTEMRRIDFANQIVQRHTTTEDSGGVLAFAIHARSPDERIVCAKNHRVSIN